MTTKDDNTKYSGECAPLITNIAEFFNSAPIPMPTRQTSWQSILQSNNMQELPKSATSVNTPNLKRAVQWYLSDSGATGHFLIEGAPVVNKRPAKFPINIDLPNGKTINSKHTCNLDIPWLHIIMTEAHLVPGLEYLSLISTHTKYNVDCQV